jgi:predicted acyltransferase
MPVAASRRIISVDILRGITIAGMILVNNPGTWDHIYWPLEHAEWNGYTPTDFVFPFFLFLVGMVIPFSLDSDKLKGKKPYKRILSRSLKLILLGIFLGAWRIHFPFIETWSKLRIPGVLQRIGVAYCIVSILYLNVNWKRLLAVGLLCLLGYFAFMTMVPLPDGSLPTLARNSNWESVIDLRIFGTHMWEPDYDPEGLLSTIPAIATAIFGVLVTLLLRYADTLQSSKIKWLLIVGLSTVILGLLWNLIFPINKRLWTSSYVLFTGGWACLFLAAIMFITDRGFTGWAKPFIWMGSNAIAIYALNEFIASAMGQIQFTYHGAETSVHGFLYDTFVASWISPAELSSCIYGILVVLFYVFAGWWLYRRKWFFKI